MQHYFFILFSTLLFSSIGSMPVGVLELKINNIKDHQGTLWIGVYPSESSFLIKEEAILYSVKNPEGNKTSIVINNLSYGDYAIALFHDLNDNGTMDVNWWGVPTEPYAFSKPLNSKWRIPDFTEVKISLYQSQKVINISLATWWEQ